MKRQDPKNSYIVLFDNSEGDEEYFGYFPSVTKAEQAFKLAFGWNPDFKLIAIAEVVKDY